MIHPLKIADSSRGLSAIAELLDDDDNDDDKQNVIVASVVAYVPVKKLSNSVKFIVHYKSTYAIYVA